jgi:hypothetical protein
MTEIETPMGPQIVVLDRGFIYHGNVSINGDMMTIERARNIRRWGTTAGLGQLAKDGPTAVTVLDNVGTVTAPMRAVIHLIQCSRLW